jgi:mRNA interferase MazF
MPSTINYQPGDLVLVEFPFTGPGTKLRPALVVLDSGDADVLLARVTTQPQTTPYDIHLTDWRQAGLLAPSFVRLHKLATLSKARIQRRLGALEAADRGQVSEALKQLTVAW